MSGDELMNKHCLCWSPSQAVFWNGTVQEMLRANMDTYLQRRNHDSDWIVVAFADTAEAIRTRRKELLVLFDQPDAGPLHLPPV